MKYRIRLDDGSEAIVDGKTARKAVQSLIAVLTKKVDNIWSVHSLPDNLMIDERWWKTKRYIAFIKDHYSISTQLILVGQYVTIDEAKAAAEKASKDEGNSCPAGHIIDTQTGVITAWFDGSDYRWEQ